MTFTPELPPPGTRRTREVRPTPRCPWKDAPARPGSEGPSARMSPTLKEATMSTTKKKVIVGGLSAVAVAALAVSLAAPAQADPPATVIPYRTLVAVGSDTTQDVTNGLSVTATDSSNYPSVLASYNATGSSTIQTRSGGALFQRPNGSTNGLRALRASEGGASFGSPAVPLGSVDLARSSSTYTTETPNALAYVPFALDAVTWASSSAFQSTIATDLPLGSFVGEGQTAGADATLGTDDDVYDLTLTNIFGLDNGNDTTGVNLTDGINTFVVGSQATSGADIIPFKPQAGSGTLQFWQGVIGGSYSDLVADEYTDGSGTHDVQEHDGAVTAALDEAIVPFSIAQHTAQGNSATLASTYGVTVTDRRNGAVLGQIDSVAPLAGGELNGSFPVKRDVYFVAATDRLTSPASTPDDQALVKFLLGGSYTGAKWVCDLDTTITDFGFGTSTIEPCGQIAGYRSFTF